MQENTASLYMYVVICIIVPECGTLYYHIGHKKIADLQNLCHSVHFANKCNADLRKTYSATNNKGHAIQRKHR